MVKDFFRKPKLMDVKIEYKNRPDIGKGVVEIKVYEEGIYKHSVYAQTVPAEAYKKASDNI